MPAEVKQVSLSGCFPPLTSPDHQHFLSVFVCVFLDDLILIREQRVYDRCLRGGGG